VGGEGETKGHDAGEEGGRARAGGQGKERKKGGLSAKT